MDFFLRLIVLVLRLTLFLHGLCMLRECIHGECAREQHERRTITLTLTHTITAYSVSGNVVCVRILICATRQNPCRKTLRKVHFRTLVTLRRVRVGLQLRLGLVRVRKKVGREGGWEER